MSTARRALWVLVVAVLFGAVQARAQDQIEYRTQPQSKLWVEGTSNKSDFKVDAGEFTGSVMMNRDVTASDPGVKSVKLTVVAAKLAGGKSTIMDRLMHQALNVEEHPTITYELTSARPAGAAASDGAAFALQTEGRLTLAGTTKNITVTVQGEKLANGNVRFQGRHALLMSDYGIAPPSAMFGALRTADEVTVHFDLVVAPAK